MVRGSFRRPRKTCLLGAVVSVEAPPPPHPPPEAMNNNLTTERAHLGVFSTSSYISIGDTYVKKHDKDPRLGGKQFAADFPKEGIGGARPNNSLFEREHKWLFGGEKCERSLRATLR